MVVRGSISAMPTIKLTYFDVHGGRAEPARIALHGGGVEFEDERVPFFEWPARKATMPYGAMPVLEVDGQVVAQSNAINRYVGKLVGLYPEDPWQAALCDEVMDAVEEIAERVSQTMAIADPEAKQRAREQLVNGAITAYLGYLARRLEAHGGEWFADGRLTMADLRVFMWTGALRKGRLEHIPTDLLDREAPTLAAHADRVAAHPMVVAYRREVVEGAGVG